MKYLNFFILLASVQGFLLAFIFGFSSLFKRTSSKYLGLLLFVVSLQNLSNGLINLGYTTVEYLPLSYTILIPLSLYSFVNYFINKNHRFGTFEKLMLVFFLGQISFKCLAFILFLWFPEYIVNNSLFFSTTYVLEVIALILTLLVLYRLNNTIGFFEQKILQEYSDIEHRTLAWLRWTLLAILILSLIWTLAFSFKIIKGEETILIFYFVWFGISFLTYWLAYSVFIRRHLFETNVILHTSLKVETIDELSENTIEHHHKLLTLMEIEKIFQDPDLSMTLLAKKMDLSKGYLSLIINKKEGKNFFEFVNHYRVEAIKKNINNPDKAHYSLLGIGLEAGFSSKSTFNSVFKKMTGKTPSQYKKSSKS